MYHQNGAVNAAVSATNAAMRLPSKVTNRMSRAMWLSARELGAQTGVERVEELLGRQPLLLGADQDREVLGHPAALDGLDADLLQRVREPDDVGRAVELAAVLQALGPGVDR